MSTAVSIFVLLGTDSLNAIGRCRVLVDYTKWVYLEPCTLHNDALHWNLSSARNSSKLAFSMVMGDMLSCSL